MLVSGPETNPICTDSLYNDHHQENWNERAKKLSKELGTYSSKDTTKQDSLKVNVQEKLKLLVKYCKK